MKTLVYLVGGPGSGKSTLMAQLTGGWARVPAPGGFVARDWLIDQDGRAAGVELGRQRGDFSGTDALPHNAIGPACDYLAAQTETGLVFGEGARLGVWRFLDLALAAGYSVVLGHLEHPDQRDWLAERSQRLGKIQSPTWVAGRVTAARNLAQTAAAAGVQVISGYPSSVGWRIDEIIHERTHHP